MSDKVAELSALFNRDSSADWISNLWDKYNDQRSKKLAQWSELRDYVFATDTSTTSNGRLPWKNNTTIPKLCQIRDNLHANYESSLFPSDRWLQWVAYSADDAEKGKAEVIKAYIENKTREGNFRTEYSKLIYDYIDYGNAFVTCSFETRHKELANGEVVSGFSGPKAVRISPLDIVFNPTATSFDNSFKIVRSVKTIGELKKLAMTEPDQSFWAEAVAKREAISRVSGGYSKEDFDKASGFSVDGFGNLYEYFQSEWVEILEFYGDYHDSTTGELSVNKMITIVDRTTEVRNVDIPSWQGTSPIRHVGWRFRPDNLWSMGPLDNLVGMQYRIDHLENLKADAMDLVVHPPLKIIGEVEEFEWGPGAEIHIDEQGDVSEVSKNLNGIITAENNIQILEDKMELMAGAPREAAGVRTPGEKTALEVQTLSNAAGRIFQAKITNFEVNLLEPNLNDMLEISARSMSEVDLVRVMDDDIGVQQFLTISKEDITANGKVRPVGARHFAKQAQDLQNLIGVLGSPVGTLVGPHTSGKGLAKFINDVVGLTGYDIFRVNVAVEEQQETSSLMNQAEEDNAVAGSLDPGMME